MLKKVVEFYFSGFFDEKKVQKDIIWKGHFFCNSMKVYTVTFDHEVHLNQDRTLQNVKQSRKNIYSPFSDIRALSHGLDIFSNIK